MTTKTPIKVKIKATGKRGRKKTAKHSVEAHEKNWRGEDAENRDLLEFMQAIDRHKRRTQKAFPTWSEILEILKSLGYKKDRG